MNGVLRMKVHVHVYSAAEVTQYFGENYTVVCKARIYMVHLVHTKYVNSYKQCVKDYTLYTFM